MSNLNEKTQRHFVKDGDDEYVPHRSAKRISNTPRIPHKNCECGGKLKPRGSMGVAGSVSSKCNKCGIRVYIKQYKGAGGLVVCY